MTALTRTPAWAALEAHAQGARDVSIQDLLATESGRMDRMALTLDGVLFDFSKHLIDARGLDLLCDLAHQQDVSGWFARMMAGDAVNTGENRAVLHTKLRDPAAGGDVAAALALIEKTAANIRADASVHDVIHIGIGGSDLGPRLVCDALSAMETKPRVHFVANADPDDLDGILRHCDPAHTLISVASKTFTTQETMLNLARAKDWLGGQAHRIIAATANVDAARNHGIPDHNILPMWDWVGGRFSLWSSVGLPIAIAHGFDAFRDLLRGAHAADRHVAEAPLDRNIPILMALLGVWYRNFLGCGTQAVLAYAHRLSHFPAYVQQLEMESNGKSVDRNGAAIAHATAPVILGGVGTNAQHAFMQMLHQGPDMIPADFIGVAAPADGGGAHALMANMLAQSRALMLGAPADGHRNIPGNRPSSCIILPRLDAFHLGLLLAVWEHKTAAQGFIWGINSFDQFGVELGKAQAKELLAPPDVLKQNESLDISTNKLIFHTFLSK